VYTPYFLNGKTVKSTGLTKHARLKTQGLTHSERLLVYLVVTMSSLEVAAKANHEEIGNEERETTQEVEVGGDR
jgi:hypothetical protein